MSKRNALSGDKGGLLSGAPPYALAPEMLRWDFANGPFCKKCGCGGDWHYVGCIRGQQRGDSILVDKQYGGFVEPKVMP